MISRHLPHGVHSMETGFSARVLGVRGAFLYLLSTLCLGFSISHVGICFAEEDRARRSVLLFASDDVGPLVGDLLEATIQVRLEGVTVVVEDSKNPSQGPSPAVDAVVLHLNSEGSTRWVLRLEYRGRVWTRDIEGPASNAAAEEATALVAAQASIALLSDDTVEKDALNDWRQQPQEDDANAEKRTVPPVPHSPHEVLPPQMGVRPTLQRKNQVSFPLSVSYRGEFYAPGFFSHGAHIDAQARHSSGWFGAIGATFSPPLHLESEPGSFDLSRLPLDLIFGYCARYEAWLFCPAAGFVFEPSRRRNTEGTSGVGVVEDDAQFSFGLNFGAHAERRLSNWVSLSIGVSAVVSLIGTEFVIEGQNDALLSPSEVRPRFDVGVVFPLWESSP